MTTTALTLVLMVSSWSPLPIQVPVSQDVHTPIRLQVEQPAESAVEGMLVSVNGDDPVYLLAQTSENDPHQRFMILPPKGESSRVSIHPSNWFHLDDDSDAGRIWVRQGNQPVLAYNYGDQLAEGIHENRTRSSYIYPIYGLNGVDLSDDFPDDHHHHRGAFWAWPGILYEDQQVDMWHIKGIRVLFEEFTLLEAGPVCARLGIQNGWYVEGEKIADEQVEITVWNHSDLGRAVDISLTWKALDSPITIEGEVNKGYGGFNLRFAPREDNEVTSAMGPHEEDSVHARFEWADYSARFRGQDEMEGMAVFAHPDNLGFPPAWLLRHYGFIGSNWPAMESHTFGPEDDPLQFQYRIWIHRGDAYEGQVDSAYRAFRNPVAIPSTP